MTHFTIRLYKDSDYEVARNLFASGLTENTSESFKLIIQQPYIWVTLCAASILPLLDIVSFATSIFTVTLALTGLWFTAQYLYTSYVQLALSDDMLDIRKYYLERDGYCFWVAESGGEVIGTIAAIPSTFTDKKKHLELKRLTVSTSHRGKGIAKALSRTLIDFARQRGCEAVVLMTTLPQINAWKMYEKMGFRRIGEYYLPMFLAKLVNFKCLTYQCDIEKPE